MSSDLKLLEKWSGSGIFHDSSTLLAELTLATIAENIYNIEYPPVEGLDIKLLVFVSAIQLYKDTETIGDVQNIYDALVAYNSKVLFDENSKREWLNNFLIEYKKQLEEINKEQI